MHAIHYVPRVSYQHSEISVRMRSGGQRQIDTAKKIARPHGWRRSMPKNSREEGGRALVKHRNLVFVGVSKISQFCKIAHF